MPQVLLLTFSLRLLLHRHPTPSTESPFLRITWSLRSTSSTSPTTVRLTDQVSARGTAVDNCLTVFAAPDLKTGPILFRGGNTLQQDWSMTEACYLHSEEKSSVLSGDTPTPRQARRLCSWTPSHVRLHSPAFRIY